MYKRQGVLIATPRTAATTFEMAVVPIAESFSANAAGADGVTIDLGVAGGGSASLALFSVIFFAEMCIRDRAYALCGLRSVGECPLS